jgi:hypothetical protein
MTSLHFSIIFNGRNEVDAKRQNSLYSIMFLVAGFFTGIVQATELPQISGVFGIDPVGETTALALWIPLNDGESIEGVRWFNNDEEATFPEVLAVAGEANQPELLADATVFGEEISGESFQWSELYFPQSLASSSGGLYIIFRLSPGSEFHSQGQGGGPGIGYIEGGGVNRCWLTGDGEFWDGLTIPFQMAIQPITNANKSSNVVVLSPPEKIKIVSEETIPEIVSLNRIKARPNPFNPSTQISFSLDSGGVIDLAVFDLRGRLVKQLESGYFSDGQHFVTWRGENNSGRPVSSGVYFLRLLSGGTTSSTAVTLTK